MDNFLNDNSHKGVVLTCFNLFQNNIEKNINHNNRLASGYSLSIGSEFFSKISYFLSNLIKVELITSNKGHYVDLETYSEYKNKRNINHDNVDLSNDPSLSFLYNLNSLNYSFLNVTKQCLEYILANDDAVEKVYNLLLQNVDSENFYAVFLDIILSCNISVPKNLVDKVRGITKKQKPTNFKLINKIIKKELKSYNLSGGRSR